MAIIRPFRGIRYNPAHFAALDAAISQPYDRITPALAEEYRRRSPYNISAIIAASHEDEPDPAVREEGYRRAQANYTRWLAEGVLQRDEQPALYAYEQTFSVDGRQYVRLGMIAALGLAEFDEGIILPHERTHAGPKADRLRLLQTLQVNTEQIFVLYPDAENLVNSVLRNAIAGRAPDIDAVELFESDVRQRVWVITDPAAIAAIEDLMAPKRSLIIADGHHRYETALNYRREQRAARPDLPPGAAANFTSATLVSMDDPGLVVLPTHREICNFTAATPAEVLARAQEHFDLASAPDLATTLTVVNADPEGHTFGFYGGPETGFHLLALRDDADLDTLITDDRSPAWKSLPASIAHRLLLEQVAGVPAQGIDDKSMVRYHRDAGAAVASVDRGNGNFVVFLAPTSIAQIKAVAALGEKMPQKSTDFYPKMVSGLVMLPVGPDEVL